jgi:regulator of protease activity HflC (stomatin/prohibitin superfamily)
MANGTMDEQIAKRRAEKEEAIRRFGELVGEYVADQVAAGRSAAEAMGEATAYATDRWPEIARAAGLMPSGTYRTGR